MSLMSFIKKQFIDVIQWAETPENPDNRLLAWRFPIEDQEIQYGGQLIVRDGQVAIFVNEGKVADIFQPGLYTLTTNTLPLLTNLKNWDKQFESPFKSDVIFINTKLQLGRRWGTAQPMTLRDAEFGMLRLRAHGAYSYKVGNAERFYKEISGSNLKTTVNDIEPQLSRLILMNMASTLGNSKIPFLDMAGNQALMSQEIKKVLMISFKDYGIELDNFVVESISLPDNLQTALDTRITVDMTGDLNRYTAYQAAQAIPLAAQNEGGMAGVGATMAAGIAMGHTMAQTMMPNTPTNTPHTLPTAPIAGGAAPAPSVNIASSASGTDNLAKLKELKALLDAGVIEQADYDATKTAILAKLSQ